ncbi:MAG: hypothetical protein ACJ77A_05040 [Actinomycetota bacterium]
MTERWREKLGRLGRAEPDRERIRSLVERGPRLPGGDPGSGRRLVAAVVALAVAVASFALVVTVFRGNHPRVSSTTPPPTPATSGASQPSALDPAAICRVPAYDPDVALLVGNETVQYPRNVLDETGTPASALDGPAADALRARLATPTAQNAPTDGWRAISTSPTAVTFAAPFSAGEWWIEAFESHEGTWRSINEEIAERRQTPAQLGHDLQLRWSGDLVLQAGAWNHPLEVVNDRPSPWVGDPESIERFAAIPHLFDPATGQPVGSGANDVFRPAGDLRLAPGSGTAVPVALGASLAALRPGTYALVACLPDLALASPVGTLRVADDAVVRPVHVLTYAPTGVSMTALAGGRLAVLNGCLGIGNLGSGPDEATYVLWPRGYALVDRGGRQVLIDPVGEEVGGLGDEVSLGGGGGPLRLVEHEAIGGIPEPCRTGGGYFIVSGSS